MVKPYKFTNCPQCWIIVFDVKSEKFREIRFPPLNREYAYYDGSLMLIKGCIHICVATYIHIQETGLIMETDGELWRMDGDRDGWTKVKDFPPTHNHPLTFDEMEDLARNLEANNRLIMEYLVNISKRRVFWSLNEDILKNTVLTTNTPYPSRKIRRIRACTHQRPQRKQAQYAVSREDQYAVLEI
ncbi:zinc finger, CCHC-type containing protein [Tanacetum coccineum]